MEKTNLSGFLFINKPAGPTSFDCIRAIRRLVLPKTKVGHTGTLDDFASGLLIVCIGREATRMVPLLIKCDKEYVVRAKLGELTDSLDRTGAVVKEGVVEAVTAEQLQQAMRSLMPSYIQIPPVYSALKHEGMPLYKLARHKHLTTEHLDAIVQQKGRQVFIKEIELLDVQLPFFTFRAVVSSGTYVRSLANDIAQRCGTDATTYDLERTKINDFLLQDATPLNEIKTHQDVLKHCISVEKMMVVLKSDYP